MRTDLWLTPPDLLRKLGPFDLDPCACPEPRPWPTAKRHYAIPQNGLREPWEGRVWLNPPYRRAYGKHEVGVSAWTGKMAAHGNGIALLFVRTDTPYWQEHIFGMADGVLFLRGRVCFVNPRGQSPKSKHEGQAHHSSALIAWGKENAILLRGLEGMGRFLSLKKDGSGSGSGFGSGEGSGSGDGDGDGDG